MARAQYILDSNIVIDLLLQVSAAFSWIKTIPASEIGITAITIMEVLQGARDKTEIGYIGRELSRFQHLHIL